MKIYLNKANESWIVDRLRDEWFQYNENISTNNIKESDVIWIIAPWMWNRIPKRYLKQKTVICTIHHIDFEKFDKNEEKNFYDRDVYVDIYHAVSKKTEEQLLQITKKRIYTIPFWINQNIFFEKNNKSELRKKYGISEKDYLIGSFQRDTEGKDLVSPKLSKGPDQFIKIVKELSQENDNLKVLLTGKRRNYVIKNLKDNSIPFYYFEMITFEELNDLYNLLDLYIVASRVEGGPQAIVECAITKTPIISTDVGLASLILDKVSLFDMNNFKLAKPNTKSAYQKASILNIPDGFNDFLNLFEESHEN